MEKDLDKTSEIENHNTGEISKIIPKEGGRRDFLKKFGLGVAGVLVSGGVLGQVTKAIDSISHSTEDLGEREIDPQKLTERLEKEPNTDFIDALILGVFSDLIYHTVPSKLKEKKIFNNQKNLLNAVLSWTTIKFPHLHEKISEMEHHFPNVNMYSLFVLNLIRAEKYGKWDEFNHMMKEIGMGVGLLSGANFFAAGMTENNSTENIKKNLNGLLEKKESQKEWEYINTLSEKIQNIAVLAPFKAFGGASRLAQGNASEVAYLSMEEIRILSEKLFECLEGKTKEEIKNNLNNNFITKLLAKGGSLKDETQKNKKGKDVIVKGIKTKYIENNLNGLVSSTMDLTQVEGPDLGPAAVGAAQSFGEHFVSNIPAKTLEALINAINSSFALSKRSGMDQQEWLKLVMPAMVISIQNFVSSFKELFKKENLNDNNEADSHFRGLQSLLGNSGKLLVFIVENTFATILPKSKKSFKKDLEKEAQKLNKIFSEEAEKAKKFIAFAKPELSKERQEELALKFVLFRSRINDEFFLEKTTGSDIDKREAFTNDFKAFLESDKTNPKEINLSERRKSIQELFSKSQKLEASQLTQSSLGNSAYNLDRKHIGKLFNFNSYEKKFGPEAAETIFMITGQGLSSLALLNFFKKIIPEKTKSTSLEEEIPLSKNEEKSLFKKLEKDPQIKELFQKHNVSFSEIERRKFLTYLVSFIFSGFCDNWLLQITGAKKLNDIVLFEDIATMSKHPEKLIRKFKETPGLAHMNVEKKFILFTKLLNEESPLTDEQFKELQKKFYEIVNISITAGVNGGGETPPGNAPHFIALRNYIKGIVTFSSMIEDIFRHPIEHIGGRILWPYFYSRKIAPAITMEVDKFIGRKFWLKEEISKFQNKHEGKNHH